MSTSSRPGDRALPEMTDARVVLVTAPDEATGVRLARTLVKEGLIACGNVVPGVTSIYRWEGEVHTDAEVLLVLKTTASRVDALLARIPALHPYEVPEILSLPVEAGLPSYLTWVASAVGSETG